MYNIIKDKERKILNTRKDKTMKKFNVENAIRNAAQIAGTEPYDSNLTENFVNDYIEAETPEEAIEFAIDAIFEAICQNSNYSNIRIENDEIIIYDDDENAVEQYYNFVASEVE